MQADAPWLLFALAQATISGLRRHWDESLALRVQHAIHAFGFPAYQHPPPAPHLTPSGEFRSVFVSGMGGRGASARAAVTGSIIHTANSYAVTGLEMEQVQEGQGKQARLDIFVALVQRQCVPCPVAPATSSPSLGYRSLPVVGSSLLASVKARIGAVEAALTMKPALAHLHMPHSAAQTAMHVGLGAVRAGECNLRIRGFSAGAYTGAVLAIAWHERQRFRSCTGDFFPIDWEALLCPGRYCGVSCSLSFDMVSASFITRGTNCAFSDLEARIKAIREGTRLYFFSEVDGLGTGGHSYGHFLDCEELFRLTPGDYRYSELTKRIGGLADPYVEKAVRSSLMGVACASIQLNERSKAFVQSMLGRQVARQTWSISSRCSHRPSQA